jgi:hypothetical protein
MDQVFNIGGHMSEFETSQNLASRLPAGVTEAA